ncbi:hypothetical protein BDQ17DRAFT_479033 [Cyathus striatus]|nr:hypothetical protein BDQ17DRAFT_479033 [Cyathus striatus]
MSEPYSQPTKQSDIFNKYDADVTFKSSDGFLFKLHKKNLSIYTGGFPTTDITADDNIIPLEEKSGALELLFQFVYPPDFPTLADVSLDVFIELSQAAEKYMVYIAMPVCRARMLHVTQRCATSYTTRDDESKENLTALVKYAIDHCYMEIIDELTPFLVVLPLKSTISLFPIELQLAWALHRDQWMITYQEACYTLSTHQRNCRSSNCRNSPTYILEKDDMFSFEEFDTTSCSYLGDSWKGNVGSSIKSIRKFSSVCNQVKIV